MSESEKKSSNLGIIVAAILAVLVIGGIAFFAMGRSSSSSSNNSSSSSSVSSTKASAMMNYSEQTIGGIKIDKNKDLIENAVMIPDLSTLVSAVSAGQITDVLKGAGPFTVFAPENTAFNKLPEGTLTNLLKPESKTQLNNILTYHVVPGVWMSSNLVNDQELTTVQGQKLKVKKADSNVMVMDDMGGTVTVKNADIMAKNGIAHVIDGVLMPATTQSSSAAASN
jgi:uncharacterized surface protein with fasciclin (FAS1) repeats